MKHLHTIIAILCLFTAPSSHAQTAIKGLAIDMSIDAALTVVNDRFSEALGQKYEIGAPTPKDAFYGFVPKGFSLKPLSSSSKDDLADALATGRAMLGAPSVFIVLSGEDRKVCRIVLPGYLTDTLFNTADMNARDFAKEILDNYKIPELSPFSINIGDSPVLNTMNGWEYSSPEGFRIRVFEDKSIEMIRIPKSNTRSFD